MYENKSDEIVVDIHEWIEKSKADPSSYLERQVIKIFMLTLESTEPYCGRFLLKGGILMGIAYGSPRQTVDIDYTTDVDPSNEMAEEIRIKLDKKFPVVSVRLGYPDIVCKVQKIKPRPKASVFESANAPGYELTVGYALRGSPQESRLNDGCAPDVVRVDISFKEPIGEKQIIRLKDSDEKISAYSLKDIISEKFRAILQQKDRNRYRRQDVYDLDVLIKSFKFDDVEMVEIYELFLEKCSARSINPNRSSLDCEEIIRRSSSEWDTLNLELDYVPNFDVCYENVNSFYKKFPWRG